MAMPHIAQKEKREAFNKLNASLCVCVYKTESVLCFCCLFASLNTFVRR